MNITRTYATYGDILISCIEEAVDRSNILLKYLKMDNVNEADTFEMNVMMELTYSITSLKRCHEALSELWSKAKEATDEYDAMQHNKYFRFDDNNAISEVSEAEAEHLGMLAEDEGHYENYDF